MSSKSRATKRALWVGMALGAGAAFGQESIDLECPCRLQSSASGATVTLAARNFRLDRDSGELRVEIRAYEQDQPLVWDDAAIADTTSHYQWRCDGTNGGSNSGTCSAAKPVAQISCGTAAWSPATSTVCSGRQDE